MDTERKVLVRPLQFFFRGNKVATKVFEFAVINRDF